MTTTGRYGRIRRISRILLASGLLVAVVGLPISGATHPQYRVEWGWLSAHGPGGGGKILNFSLNATDAPAFTPNGLAASAGDQISLHIVNPGTYAHTFTLSRVANFTIPLDWSPSRLSSFFAANGSLVDASLAPSVTTVVNFTVPADADGSFEFVSTVAYQFQAGMHGFLNVSAPVTGPPTQLTLNTTNGPLFDPNILALQSAGSVSLLITNQGSLPHTFTLVPQSNVTITPGNFTAYFQTHAPLANVNVPSTAGGTVYANFTVPRAGIYEFLCEVPGHLSAGMAGELYVGVTPPFVPGPPSTAIIQPLVLYGAAGLLAVGALLAGIAGLAGRFPESAGGEGEHH